jgi:hypothetical protein
VYEPTSEKLHERPLFRKVGDHDTWLRFAPDKQWALGTAQDKDDGGNNCYASSVETDLALPQDVKLWRVLDEFNSYVWPVQLSISVTEINEQVVSGHSYGGFSFFISVMDDMYRSWRS